MAGFQFTVDASGASSTYRLDPSTDLSALRGAMANYSALHNVVAGVSFDRIHNCFVVGSMNYVLLLPQEQFSVIMTTVDYHWVNPTHPLSLTMDQDQNSQINGNAPDFDNAGVNGGTPSFDHAGFNGASSSMDASAGLVSGNGPVAVVSAVATAGSPTVGKKGKGSAKVPRPPNAFILYRKEHHSLLKAANPEMHNNDISVLLGAQWKAESPETRAKYHARALKFKADLEKKFPDYKYQPRKPSQIKKRASRATAARGAALVTNHGQLAMGSETIYGINTLDATTGPMDNGVSGDVSGQPTRGDENQAGQNLAALGLNEDQIRAMVEAWKDYMNRDGRNT